MKNIRSLPVRHLFCSKLVFHITLVTTCAHETQAKPGNKLLFREPDHSENSDCWSKTFTSKSTDEAVISDVAVCETASRSAATSHKR